MHPSNVRMPVAVNDQGRVTCPRSAGPGGRFREKRGSRAAPRRHHLTSVVVEKHDEAGCAIACEPLLDTETSSVVSAYTRRMARRNPGASSPKPPMKPFVPTTPTFVPSTSHTVQERWSTVPPRRRAPDNRVALVRVPVVVPKDGDDRNRERTARVGDDRRLLGPRRSSGRRRA